MENFNRFDLSFSLCGLNCALCTMKLNNYCPGCGGGLGNQGCAIAKCSMGEGGYQYCSECGKYPCSKYDGITGFDSFITHRNQLKDMAKMKELGSNAYRAELEKKADILEYLLDHYNDGRRKSFFCLAVNLFDLCDIEKILSEIKQQSDNGMAIKEKAAIAVKCFEDAAKPKGIILKLNKKPSKKKPAN